MTTQASTLSPEDQRTATRVAEEKAAHWQGVADRQRAQMDALALANAALYGELERAREANQELLVLVGTSTPIAAFDLATTWHAEKALEQTEHYGDALTRIALGGGSGLAQEALATAPHKDRTVAERNTLLARIAALEAQARTAGEECYTTETPS